MPYKWTAGQKRADGSERDLEKGKLPDDVLEQHALMPWAKESIGYPTQKPEALVEKFVSGCSNEGDTIADFFSGGGTTAAVAQRLGRRWIASDISRVAVSITADRVASVVEKAAGEAEAKGKAVAIPDFKVKHWAVYEITGLAKMPEEQFRDFVLAAFEARPDSTEGVIHGYKGKDPVHVGSRDPEVPTRKEDVVEFANAVLARRGSGGSGTMIGWAFSEQSRQMAERIAANEKLQLNFVKLRLMPVESPEFAAHIAEKHDRYVDLLSFVLPPSINLKRTKVGERTWEFDVSESTPLNSGAKLINAQWDFDYQKFFTSSPGMSLRRTKKGDPDLTATYEFPAIGTYEIAVRVQDDLGGEAVMSKSITVT